MPLLSATVKSAKHLCLKCRRERTIKASDWIRSSADQSVFSTPPCPSCHETETFTWHNWVYVGANGKPDNTNFGAIQMSLIAVIAKGIGRTRRLLPDRPKNLRYRESPKIPTPAKIRKSTLLNYPIEKLDDKRRSSGEGKVERKRKKQKQK